MRCSSFMSTFWHHLPKPFTVGAPMDDVTDIAFRTVIAKYGKPDVMFTEFTSADGLVRAPEAGKQKLLKKLLYTEVERPIVAQLFSAVPERMRAAASLVAKLGFDGIDINTGCPDKTIEKQGCGCALIKHPDRFRALYQAAVMGVKDAGCTTPVSVKCRIGYAKNEIDTWVRTIFEERPPAVTIHLRTREEMSKVPAHWELMPTIVALRDAVSPETVVIGNGDVKNVDDARHKALETRCDGVMIGRGMFGNPWYGTMHYGTPQERIIALIDHIHVFERELSDTKSFAVMKKHFGSYIAGFEGAHDIRTALMITNSAAEATALLKAVL